MCGAGHVSFEWHSEGDTVIPALAVTVCRSL